MFVAGFFYAYVLRALATSGGKFLLKQLAKRGARKTTALVNYYPANNGALGAWSDETLQVGTKIDRYGSEFGKFFSSSGTPDLMRALPPGNTGVLNSYQVLKPFTVQSSTIAPAFGRVGTGIQYLSPVNAKTLLKRGIIGPL